jgi:hypothetical protein
MLFLKKCFKIFETGQFFIFIYPSSLTNLILILSKSYVTWLKFLHLIWFFRLFNRMEANTVDYKAYKTDVPFCFGLSTKTIWLIFFVTSLLLLFIIVVIEI